MKLILLAGLVIALPAIAALVYSILAGNRFIMYAALASFAVGTLPFVAAFFLFKGKEADVGH